MCGVLGIVTETGRPEDIVEQTRRLIRLNESRGDWSIGFLALKRTGFQVYRHTGRFNEYDEASLLDIPDLRGIVAHLRTPTGKNKTDEYTHPLETDRFLLSHNGILLNHRSLLREFGLPSGPAVDSWSMLAVIQKLVDDNFSPAEAVTIVANKTRGQFACWLFDKATLDVYLFRQMSPTFLAMPFFEGCNLNHPMRVGGFIFSSTAFEGYTHELLEGKVMRLSNQLLSLVGEFRVDRHYIT
jgi:glucosamine 6-phosphate synthetase-like amidotransferase/phosphosugar isomerase protein